jgi:serine/threonine protein kinase/Tfp pilus assembly protein PilF
MSLQPGERFGRYELVSQLGRGGMAETYRARLIGEAGVTKPVLIKKVLPEFANDQAFTTMFVSEARISATLSHGNIAQVYDFGRVDGEYFLAMEYVNGQPLHRILKRTLATGLTGIPVPLAAFIGIELCRGLHYAHTRTDDTGKPLGIVHRDISPDNVLISYEGQVKIVDFGIAKARELRGFNTEPGIVKGKYLFFSPEQARGKEVDARTDVWASGVVLYELLCGRLPVEGLPYVVVPQLVKGEFPRPRVVNPDLPPELDAIVMRALTVDRDERYESCHEFGDALAGFLYSTEPRFSAMSLSYFVQQLFREDLASEGRRVQIPQSFLEQLTRWQAAVPRTAPLPVAALGTAPEPESEPEPELETSETNVRPASPSSRTAVFLGGGAVGVLALVGLLFFIKDSAAPPVADPSMPQPLKIGGSPRAPPGPPKVIETAAKRDVVPPQPGVAPMRTKEARAAYEKAIELLKAGEPTQALTQAENCLTLDSRVVECHMLAGAASTRLDLRVQASRHYREFLRLAPYHSLAPEVRQNLEEYERQRGPITPQQVEQTRVAYEDGRRFLKVQQYSNALLMVEQCLSIDPDHAECHMVAGATYASMENQMEKAAYHYREFLRLTPDHKLAPRIKQNLDEYERRNPR